MINLKKKTFLITEIGQAHDGSLGLAHSYIDALKDTGIDAVKFQIHYADAESSKYEKFRIKFSYQDKTRYDYWKRIEFSPEQWSEIKRHCEKVNLKFIASPFSIKAVDVLNKMNTKFYKIASGEIDNYLMIDKINMLKKNIIISTGLSDIKEIHKTLHRLDKKKISLLQCTSSYPTAANNIGLNVIEDFKKIFRVPVGLSDHSGNKNTILAACALGADLVEFHVTFNKKSFGPDSISSIEIDKVKGLVDGAKHINKIISNPINKNKENKKLMNIKKVFGKSLAFNCDLKKNTKISINHLETKKPYGKGVPCSNYQSIIGKKIKRDIKKGTFLKLNFFKNEK